MDRRKLIHTIDSYSSYFKSLDVQPVRHARMLPFEDRVLGFQHCHFMIEAMRDFVAEERLDKAFRWLGFVQGFLWSQGAYTIEDLADHNRSTFS